MSGRSTACWIVTIGDELINGSRVDTNTAWLGSRLSEIGIAVERAVSVGDRTEAIAAAVGEAIEAAGIVILSGGLGPTQDDRTKEALADHFGVGMERAGEVEESVRRFFADRGRTPSQVNLDQALVPDGFGWHLNPSGTAPGLLKRTGTCLLFALPGVPSEMKALYEEWVGPLLAAEIPAPGLIRRRWYRTTGIGESDLYERIGGLEELAPDVDLAYLPSPDGVSIYVTARGPEAERVDGLLEEASRRIREGAGSHLYAEVDRRLAEHVASLMETSGATLATAESCTGGALANALTNVPGASGWFLRGWVVYADESKTDELGVPADLIAAHGAVSAEVAGAMAEGALMEAGTDYALAITGIAGPGGGTEEKPVGTTFIALAGGGEPVVRRYRFGSFERVVNKRRSVAAALDLLRRRLEGLDTSEGGWAALR